MDVPKGSPCHCRKSRELTKIGSNIRNFCDVPTATNDGSEFRLQNGGFVNAKLRKVRRGMSSLYFVPSFILRVLAPDTC